KQTLLLPSVPPIANAVPGFDWEAWQGIVAPAGTPKEIIGRLATELEKIEASPEFKEQLFRFGMDSLPPKTPEEFAATIKAEQPRWQRRSRIPARKSISLSRSIRDKSCHRRSHPLPHRAMVPAAAAAWRATLHRA